ncbi:MAG TPA: hypothetical protein VN253_12150, partial [Kofleriaceae bacterium]|nr:hypothetical protein [Kofleriaceae bacterium]
GSNIDGGRGQQGTADATKYGAGGGAVGRIRLHTRIGSADVQGTAVLSPALTDNPTRCTQGTAAVQ